METFGKDDARNTCPSGQQLAHFAAGNLPSELIDEVARHLDSCSVCRAHLTRLDETGSGSIDQAVIVGDKSPVTKDSECEKVVNSVAENTLPGDGLTLSGELFPVSSGRGNQVESSTIPRQGEFKRADDDAVTTVDTRPQPADERLSSRRSLRPALTIILCSVVACLAVLLVNWAFLGRLQLRPVHIEERDAASTDLEPATEELTGLNESPYADPLPPGHTATQDTQKMEAAFQWPENAPPPAIAPFNGATARKYQQLWAEYLKVPVEKEVDLGEEQKLTMVLIPPGEFLMGSTSEEQARFVKEGESRGGDWAIDWISNEGPQHRVRIAQPFRLSRFEVTRGQFRQFVGATGYKTEAEQDGRGGKKHDGRR